MNPNFILQIAIACPLRTCFDYLPPPNYPIENLVPGIRLRVPFGKREVIGILLSIRGSTNVPLNKLRPVLEILDTEPILPPGLLELAQWASGYYHEPLGEVVLGALPTLLRKGRATDKIKLGDLKQVERRSPLQLNPAQKIAVDRVCGAFGQFETFLLYGVTGSGKTEVYLQIIDQTLKNNKQALVLVPEIGLTPQTVSRFRERFPVPIVTLHSGMTEKERLQAWWMAKTGEASIVIGTRSALFAPLLNPGIIIVDEEHDLSFKQQDGFRYSARDLAIMRGRIEKIPIVLGSATPSLESFANVQQERYHLLELPERAGTAINPTFHILDMRKLTLVDDLFAPALLKAITSHLQRDGQILLFLNRRGYAPVVMCHTCGWIAHCPHCDAPMTLHHKPEQLQCHHCGVHRPPIKICPECKTGNLFSRGIGTERIELSLQQQFPDVPIVRVDRDSTSTKGALEQALETIHSGHGRILIGTQMLAKGHHFPDVSLVVILNVDSGLYSVDFRATERLAQLLLQVAGRAGRAEKPGEVIIQTHCPDHPLLGHLIKEGYTGFAKAALEERKLSGFPPHGYLALLRADAVKQDVLMPFLKQIQQIGLKIADPNIQILGPVPAPLERRAGRYRGQLLLQAHQRPHLQHFLSLLIHAIDKLKFNRQIRWSLDIDPVDLI